MSGAPGLNLDTVTLKDLFAVFTDFADEGAMGASSFIACLQRMGVGIPALAERLFHVFDKDRSGRLDFRSFATGLSLICNEAPVAERLELTFSVISCNTTAGIVSATEVQSLAREFLWAGMDVV